MSSYAAIVACVGYTRAAAMSNAFVFKAAAGMLIFAAAPTYCVYALIQFGRDAQNPKGSFASEDGSFRWEGPETLDDVKGTSRPSMEVGPRSVAKRVAAFLEREK